METTIVCSCIQNLISCIGIPAVKQQIDYLVKAEEYVKELIELEERVKARKEDIQNQIADAERDGKQPTKEVKLWIKNVEDRDLEVETVKRDHEQSGRCGCRLPNCWSSYYKIGRRASKLLEKLKALEERARVIVFTRDAPPAPVVEQIPTTSNVVGNMITINKEKICRYLEEEPDGVIGIWGMGGVGKTTLLEAINHNFLNNNGDSGINKLFDYVIFITVSKEYQPGNLQKMIVKRLGLRETEGLVPRAQIIYDYLKEKNFLLLMDDIWEVVQLKDLGIPDPRSNNERRFRRKVVFTTRSSQVCADMKCHKKIEVECLEEVEAWDLFKENIGEDKINLPDIRSRAEEVARECGGLPLALVVIGRAMATKERPGEWDHALTQLKKSQPSKIHGMEKEENYFLRLKFSYDSLRDDEMRKCFLCCSLWPEDYEIKKKEIIMCWMGLGLIDGFENIKEAYDEGHTLIRSLIGASLLQPVQDKDGVIKVHDVIRDLALWIACDSGKDRNRWLVKAGVGLKEVPNLGVAERVSLMKNAVRELPTHLPPCDNLSTLLLQENEFTLILGSFFTCMPNLTYLDLSYNLSLQAVPKEICFLVQLRYLNLSDTKISSLPEELGQLINLKYLLVRDTGIQGEVNRGIIGRLLKLVYLDLFPYGYVETDELLRLRPSLKGVGMKITSEHALQQLSCVVASILHLNIELDMGGDSSTTTSIHLHHLLSSTCTKLSLRELRFSECQSIRELVDVHLPRLESLQLVGLENLTEIVWRRSVVPPSECFQRLRELYIYKCNGLKDIMWVLHLPCLERLELDDCEEMEQLVVIGGGEGRELEVTKPTTFPKLRRLTLFRLPKLAMICDNHHDAAAVNFPSLEVLCVSRCNRLKDITWVLHLSCLETLRVFDCEEMEQLVVIGGGEGRELEVTKPTFPRLRELELWGLPKLAMICDNHAADAVNFPSLEKLVVRNCKELKRLPFHPQLLNNCSRLKEITGEREWWEGIEWELDQSAHSSLLQPFFVAYLW